MALTKAQRDALPSSDFAVPGKRVLPICDAEHVKMSWGVIDDTKGLTDEEKASGRMLIMARASQLKMDVKDWKISAMSWNVPMSAMSLDVPETPDHPNKAPFTGILVRLDQPSDKAPHGSFGMKTILTSAAAEAALGSLLGMGVNYASDMKGHNKTQKIGIIDSATIDSDASGKYIKIGGFLYASDFPDVTASIKSQKDLLGFSFEAERLYVSDSKVPNSLEIDKLTFTGAAILRKDTAAYSSTSIAAAAEEIVMDEELKKMLETMTGTLTDVSKRLEKVEAGQSASIQAASVLDKVKPHSDSLRKTAEKMAAAGIGGHATRGHVHILNHMADSMEADACKGMLASAYSPPGMYAAGEPPVTPNAEIKELKDLIGNMSTQIKNLAAAAERSPSSAPQRQTLTPAITHLMAKAGVQTPGEGTLIKIADLDNVLGKSNLDVNQRLQIKVGLRNAGLLDNAA